jgi:crossover junction endodeoxyribonuclease RuvC
MVVSDPSAAPTPLILGIDPGLRACGWGVVAAGAGPSFLACGVVKPRPRDPLGERLLAIHGEISHLIRQYGVTEMAIEDPFVGALAPASALAIGQARAVALLAAAAAGIDAALYAPAAVKAAVSGYGQSDKRQVQRMVRLLLGLETEPEPADAADALAVALCHASQRRTRAIATAARVTRRRGGSGSA